MAYETLLLEKQGYIAILTLNRPPTNSVSYAMLEELDRVFDELASDKEVRVLVLTGAGDRCFCAGMDVADAVNHPDVGPKGAAIWKKLDRFEKPVIAAINGHALGGGCELALAAHFRLMTDNPKALMGCPELNLGIIPGWGGTQRMARLLGRTKALDLILFSRRLSPEQALAVGLVEKVCPASSLLDEALSMARELSERPPIAVKAVLRAVSVGLDVGIEEGYKAEAEGSRMAATSKDAVEGFTAFMQKRKPEFKGE